MCLLHDRGSLEARTIEAHSLYIEALAMLERLHAEFEKRSLGVTRNDVIEAECLLAERRFVLMDLLNELGYTPKALTAKLPPRPGKGARRPDATRDPDLAALRRSYLEWRGSSESVETGPASRSMMNLGRILTLLGALPEEDETIEVLSGAAVVH